MPPPCDCSPCIPCGSRDASGCARSVRKVPGCCRRRHLVLCPDAGPTSHTSEQEGVPASAPRGRNRRMHSPQGGEPSWAGHTTAPWPPKLRYSRPGQAYCVPPALPGKRAARPSCAAWLQEPWSAHASPVRVLSNLLKTHCRDYTSYWVAGKESGTLQSAV